VCEVVMSNELLKRQLGGPGLLPQLALRVVSFAVMGTSCKKVVKLNYSLKLKFST